MRETKVILNICRLRSGCNCFEHPKWQVYSTPGSFVRQQGTPRITLMHILHTRSLYCVCQQLQDWQCTRLLKEEHDKYTRIPLAFGGISVTCSYSMKFWLKKCCWRSKYLEHMWVSLSVWTSLFDISIGMPRQFLMYQITWEQLLGAFYVSPQRRLLFSVWFAMR